MDLISGTMPDWFGSGSGSGDGYGYGYGYGYGSGYGYGYGSGDGYGSGSGDGYGYGYGSGDGYGSGSGDGSGSGSGDGSGDGSGSGDGDGYGYGYGSGSGDGYGYGYGDGSKEYWTSVLNALAQKLSETAQKRLGELRAAGATIAFWRSDKAGKACNGGSNTPVEPGTVETIKGPLKICTSQALHATTIPPKWKGDRVWIVALIGEVQWLEDKCGALCREIIGEAL